MVELESCDTYCAHFSEIFGGLFDLMKRNGNKNLSSFKFLFTFILEILIQFIVSNVSLSDGMNARTGVLYWSFV